MILDLVKPTHPLLTTKLEPFDFANPPINPGELANNLIETLIHHKGLGLSANQCGLPYRVFVMWSNPTKVCFNPRIVDITTDEVQMEEGCLSFPNLIVPVKRPSIIKVRYQDVTGEMINDKFVGMTARCFQHELDHLNGIVYTSKVNPFHLQRAQRKQMIANRKMRNV
jgi:peptide deformylase